MLRNGLEPWHLIIVLVAAFLLFGAKRLPDTARALGKSLRILKSETKALKEDFKEGAAGESSAAGGAQGPAGTPAAQRTIQAAPGDTASARPVGENNAAQG
ncbi:MULTISPECIES: Sec-independent protein translocase subunit TatA [Streptomycetaceae]|uniref:Sec-independent protein translocase protein TatA n=1 Tax=Streptantibioticus cattleyicolor (strain ATCC 35852 / DSM 46488 / JCM 4925 / NBRC 14057 / NRRL 8057) TaxID=1003195 RepID=F8JTK5_STREN|nr:MULTISPECIES: Sec-independent protein translocase subunit TatA [Streptomycetaceae]AEW95572.1 twin-arginine translocation protein, TatA/E family subunit [Streptantibioticus cattleyicolor NRRL 8057 = DSM 46488]MYS60124.1 twin-arginine translocase TatA/TatE family subunit [Streptomyces sp. SID5468]CCB75910.1 Sec-independent protein translocase protein tatA/E homolog [Streptantibioticus cattleyicolor NRRL 8057 = DSM 46488]